jgi:hypothetical protein
MNKFVKYPALMVMMLLVAMVAAACNSGGGGGGTSNTPEDATKAFFEASFSGNADQARATSCASLHESLATYLDAVSSTFATADASVDLSGLTFTKASESGDNAVVNVGGTMSATIAGQSAEVPFEGAEIPLVKEGGSWKVCGLG